MAGGNWSTGYSMLCSSLSPSTHVVGRSTRIVPALGTSTTIVRGASTE